MRRLALIRGTWKAGGISEHYYYALTSVQATHNSARDTDPYKCAHIVQNIHLVEREVINGPFGLLKESGDPETKKKK